MSSYVRLPDTAVLRFGPFRMKVHPVSRGAIILAIIASLAIYLVLFLLFANTAIAHTYPTDHTNFWAGLQHGYFVAPNFILSWFVHDVTIYQSPNDGFGYNLGYIVGFIYLVSTARS